MTLDDQTPMVHVSYKCLTSGSKRKLEELLVKWSEWHGKHVPSLDSNEILESGNGTYFPALSVGTENQSSVTFWIENEVMEQQAAGLFPLECKSAPRYDRGYAFGLSSIDGVFDALEDASRCFNCGAYNHSLRDCPRPRDGNAINNARKQYKSKRNPNAMFCNPTRYYEEKPTGKFGGLKPGELGVETRKLLGLGALDPPPWLDRMRNLGYPPGYLVSDDMDVPSGITIYADEETEEEEISGQLVAKPPAKMSIQFPGINAPIPVNANERGWMQHSGPTKFINGSSHQKPSCSNPVSRWHPYDRMINLDHSPRFDTDAALSPSGQLSRSSNFGSGPWRTSPLGAAPGSSRSLSDRKWGNCSSSKCPIVPDNSSSKHRKARDRCQSRK